MSGLSVRYEGAEIYDEVSVARCWHDMRAWGALDELAVTFGDTSNLWGSWGPSEGDEIEVSDGAARTGRMWVSAVQPRSSAVDIRAYPVPPSMREARSRSWESVRLRQLVESIAAEHGMGCELWGVEDRRYAHVEQRGESDLSFLARRLGLEGATVTAYDGTVVCWSAAWAEAQEPGMSVEIAPGMDYELRDDGSRAFGSCSVTDGRTSGSFSAGAGRLLRRVVPDRITDRAEAARFARGLLWEANRERAVAVLRTDTMLRGLAPGSMVEIEAETAPAWSGPALVSRLRHDYLDAKSKIWMARPFGGWR